MNGRLNDRPVVTGLTCLPGLELEIARRPWLYNMTDQVKSLDSLEGTCRFSSCSVLKLTARVRTAGGAKPGLDCGAQLLTAIGKSGFVTKESAVTTGDSRGDL